MSMRKVFVSLLMVIALTCGSSIALGAFDPLNNLMINGSFEEDSLNWFTAGGVIDDTTASDGVKSGKLDCSDSQQFDWRSGLYEASPGENYRFEFDYKTDVDATGSGPQIRFRFWKNVNGSNFATEAVTGLPLTDGQWSHYVFESFTCPADAIRWDVFFTTNRFSDFKGIVWLDNVQAFEEVDGTVCIHPEPEDGDDYIELSTNLAWDPPLDFPTTANYTVYIATDPNFTGVSPVTTISDPNQTSYVPGEDLAFGTTYYWKVDATNSATSTTYEGTTWSFTTIPAKAHTPEPVDDATDVSLLQILSWGTIPNAESYDVYIGTDEALVTAGDASVFKENVTGTTLLPALDQFQTEYFWRVDVIVNGITSEGDVWSFTTAAPQCDPVLEADINNDCLVNLLDLALLANDWMHCTLVNAECP